MLEKDHLARVTSITVTRGVTSNTMRKVSYIDAHSLLQLSMIQNLGPLSPSCLPSDPFCKDGFMNDEIVVCSKKNTLPPSNFLLLQL